ncbi:pikachurin-like [Ptychodera flava]|uniref:pikachurin-like n=1 Tax=Ptychodera flava TaxID=63121 RepID=UPI00396A711B
MDKTIILLFTLSLAVIFSSSTGQYLYSGAFPFRGHCGQMSPCSQICEDLPHGYYRCDCWKGHKLARNGYMCIDEVIKTDVKVKNNHQGDDPNASSLGKGGTLGELRHNKVIEAMETAAKEMEEEVDNSVKGTPEPCGEDLSCLNSGQCVLSPITGSHVCQCPLGTLGKQCQIDSMEVKYPQLWGNGYVAFPKLLTAYKTFQITLEFRPTKLNGLLLFSSERPTARGDFFSVALINGHAEFRFNCGTGAAIIRSNYTVTLNKWHKLTVYRSRYSGWLQVNDEEAVHGQSPGLYNRITLRELFYLGGYKNITAISRYTGIDRGFAGCVKSLTVNEHRYDMRKRIEKTNKRGQVVSQIGDILEGMDVGECSSSVCKNVTCHGGGTCLTDSVDTYICLCPLGRAGIHCEQEITIHIPSFSGTSYMTYEGLNNTKLSYLEVEIIFRPRTPNGLILYDALRTDTTGDFISLAMSGGHLEFRFDCGTGPAIVRSHSNLTLDEWHVAVFSRTGLEGILELDDEPAVKAKAEGAFTQTSFSTDLYLGGHDNWDVMAKYAAVNSSFIGDVQKVVINDKPLDLVEHALAAINIINADHPCVGAPCQHDGDCVPNHDVYTCDCHLGYEGDNCENELLFSDDAKEFEFHGRSYLHLTHPDLLKRVTGSKIDVKLSFKTTRSDGLILWTGQDVMTRSSDYLALGLEQGHLKFSYNLGSGEAVIISNHTVTDGEWHRVHLHREGREATLTVDSVNTVTGTSPGRLKQLNTNNGLYLGGMNDIVELSQRRYASGLSGCLQSVTLATDYHLDLIADATDARNIKECGA